MKGFAAALLAMTFSVPLIASETIYTRPHAPFRNGLAPVPLGGKWGYIDRDGQLAIYPAFLAAGELCNDGLARVTTEDGARFIDANAETVVRVKRFPARELECFSEGLAAVRDGREAVFIDRSGNIVIRNGFSWAFSFTGGLAAVRLSDIATMRYIDRAGRFRGPRFTFAAPFFEGLAAVQQNRICGYMTRDGQFAFPQRWNVCSNFSEGRAFAGEVQKLTLIDRAGDRVGDDTYENAWPFSQGLAAVRRSGKWGYIDRTGKTAIRFAFDDAREFSENVAAAKLNGKWGYIGRRGRWAVDPGYDDADSFSEARALVLIGKQRAYIDRKGRFIWRVSAAEREFAKRAEARRIQEETQNSIPYEDPLTGIATDSLLDQFLDGGDLSVLPTLAVRLGTAELVERIAALPPDQLSIPNRTENLARSPREQHSMDIHALTAINGVLHLVYTVGHLVAERDYLGNPQRWATATFYRRHDSNGWSDPQPLPDADSYGEISIVPRASGALSMIAIIANHSSVKSHLGLSPGGYQLASFDRHADGRWSPIRLLLSGERTFINGLSATEDRTGKLHVVFAQDTITHAVLDGSSIAIEVLPTPDGMTLDTPRVFSDPGLRVMAAAQDADDWFRVCSFARQPAGWSIDVGSQIDTVLLGADSGDEMTASVNLLGSEAHVLMFGSSATEAVQTLCAPAGQRIPLRDFVSTAQAGSGLLVAFARGSAVYLLKAVEGGATVAAPFVGSSDGDLMKPHLAVVGDRYVVAYIEWAAGGIALNVVSRDDGELVWGPPEQSITRAMKGKRLSETDRNFLSRSLFYAAGQMELSHHGPRAIALYEAAEKLNHSPGAIERETQLCAVHRTQTACAALNRR